MKNETTKLTEREVEYIQLVAAGNSDKQISNTWTRAGETTRTHRQNIRAKYSVRNFYAVITLAHQQKKVDLNTIKVIR